VVSDSRFPYADDGSSAITDVCHDHRTKARRPGNTTHDRGHHGGPKRGQQQLVSHCRLPVCHHRDGNSPQVDATTVSPAQNTRPVQRVSIRRGGGGACSCLGSSARRLPAQGVSHMRYVDWTVYAHGQSMTWVGGARMLCPSHQAEWLALLTSIGQDVKGKTEEL